MKPIIISGAEICGTHMSGIPRYIQETIKNIDKILDEEGVNLDVRICYPKGKTMDLPELKHIKKSGA